MTRLCARGTMLAQNHIEKEILDNPNQRRFQDETEGIIGVSDHSIRRPGWMYRSAGPHNPQGIRRL